MASFPLFVLMLGHGAAAVCGDGVTEGSEECDDGGICIGSANAGSACTASQDCPGGQCKPFGGDGCASNCTLESDVVFGGETDVFGNYAIRGGQGTQEYILTGTQTLTIGKDRDGQIPVVVKAGSVAFFPEPLPFGCPCLRAVAAMTCGGTLYEPDGVTLSADCTPASSPGDDVCAGKNPCAFVHGPGNAASGVIACDHLDNVDLSVTQDLMPDGTPGVPLVQTSGTGGPGSAVLLYSSMLGLVSVRQCLGTDPKYGPDGKFCTDDDPPAARGTLLTLPLVTGAATTVLSANGFTLGPYSTSGSPFSCAALSMGSATGAALTTGFSVQSDDRFLGNLVLQVLQVAKPAACTGDCNGDGTVTVDEIISEVNIALRSGSSAYNFLDNCLAADANHDFTVTVDEIITAVHNLLNGCSAVTSASDATSRDVLEKWKAARG